MLQASLEGNPFTLDLTGSKIILQDFLSFLQIGSDKNPITLQRLFAFSDIEPLRIQGLCWSNRDDNGITFELFSFHLKVEKLDQGRKARFKQTFKTQHPFSDIFFDKQNKSRNPCYDYESTAAFG